jgi:hypothetical protein
MPTLANILSITAPVSALLRKSRRIGICNIHDMIDLAVARGCHHYSVGYRSLKHTPSAAELADDELTILLLIGENPYQPTAIRCAAQMARSTKIDPIRLSRLAVMEKTERVLAHIARAGVAHDAPACDFWQIILDRLPRETPRPEPDLPHWSRFVSAAGRQRKGVVETRWLTPAP